MLDALGGDHVELASSHEPPTPVSSGSLHRDSPGHQLPACPPSPAMPTILIALNTATPPVAKARGARHGSPTAHPRVAQVRGMGGHVSHRSSAVNR